MTNYCKLERINIKSWFSFLTDINSSFHQNNEINSTSSTGLFSILSEFIQSNNSYMCNMFLVTSPSYVKYYSDSKHAKRCSSMIFGTCNDAFVSYNLLVFVCIMPKMHHVTDIWLIPQMNFSLYFILLTRNDH